MAGIALVKSSVDFIKSNIDTCKDIGEIAGAIDGLLQGHQEVNKKSGQRGLGFKEQFDASHIARETIDAKIAAEQLQEVSMMINMRFGPDTWKEILEERARRIQEQKAHEKAVRLQKIKDHKELMSQLKMIAMVTASIMLIMCIIVGSIYYSRL